MQCSTFFQPFIDWLNTPPDSGLKNAVSFLIVGNRSEANRFVLYMEGDFYQITGSQLFGSSPQYFSDRVAANLQPFDRNQIDNVSVTLSVPNGPLVFESTVTGNLVAQFSTLECRDSGLLVCTSDFDSTILVISFLNVSVPLLH